MSDVRGERLQVMLSPEELTIIDDQIIEAHERTGGKEELIDEVFE